MNTGRPTFRETVQSFFDLLDSEEDWTSEDEAQLESAFWKEVKDGGHAIDTNRPEARRIFRAVLWKTDETPPDLEAPCISPRTLRCALSWLRGLKERFEDGEQDALLETIQVCAIFNLPIPDWARLEFFYRYRKYQHFEAKDLGEAFDLARPKGQWTSAAKRKLQILDRLYMAVQYRHEYFGESLGHGMNSLWPRIAKHFSLSVATARKYYYEMSEEEKREAQWKWREWKSSNEAALRKLEKDKNSKK